MSPPDISIPPTDPLEPAPIPGAKFPPVAVIVPSLIIILPAFAPDPPVPIPAESYPPVAATVPPLMVISPAVPFEPEPMPAPLSPPVAVKLPTVSLSAAPFSRITFAPFESCKPAWAPVVFNMFSPLSFIVAVTLSLAFVALFPCTSSAAPVDVLILTLSKTIVAFVFITILSEV